MLRRIAVLAGAFVGLSAAASGAQAAEVHRFKLDLTMEQSAEWHQSYRDREWCGQDYHRELTGTGSGVLSGTLSGGRVKFTVRRSPVIGTHAVSSVIRFPATRTALATWSGYWAGTPEGCPADLPSTSEGWFDTSDCGPTRGGRIFGQLNVVRGRMWLSGTYDPPGADILCADPTDVSAEPGIAGPSASRKVIGLLRSKRRTIRVGAAFAGKRLAAKDMAFLPEGSGNELRDAGGEADARWKVTLTRIPR